MSTGSAAKTKTRAARERPKSINVLGSARPLCICPPLCCHAAASGPSERHRHRRVDVKTSARRRNKAANAHERSELSGCAAINRRASARDVPSGRSRAPGQKAASLGNLRAIRVSVDFVRRAANSLSASSPLPPGESEQRTRHGRMTSV